MIRIMVNTETPAVPCGDVDHSVGHSDASDMAAKRKTSVKAKSSKALVFADHPYELDKIPSGFGQRLTWLAERMGFGQREFHRWLTKRGVDVSFSALNAWMTGTNAKGAVNPGLFTVEEIWRAFRDQGVSLTWLITGEGPRFGERPPVPIPPALQPVIATTKSPIVIAALLEASLNYVSPDTTRTDWERARFEFELAERSARARIDPELRTELGRVQADFEREQVFNPDRHATAKKLKKAPSSGEGSE